MFAAKLLVVAILSIEIQCADCSLYPDEESCNYKGSLSCKFNESSSLKCSALLCSRLLTETECTNNGVIPCYWNNSKGGLVTDPCFDPSCSYFPVDTCVTLGNTYGLDCYAGSSSCLTRDCFSYNDEATCNAGLKCKWGGLSCSFQSCSDKSTDTLENCQAYEPGSPSPTTSCKYTAGDGTTPATCTAAYCSDYNADADSCVANNGKLDCAYNATATGNKCHTRSCSDFATVSDCDSNASKYGCTWSSIFHCWPITCGDLDASKEVCESAHPDCHFDGTCKAGSSAKAIGVSQTLSMLLLLFLAFFLIE